MRRLGLAAAAALTAATALAATTAAIGATDGDEQERLELTSRIAIAPKKLGTRTRPRPTEASGEVSATLTQPEEGGPFLLAGALLVPRAIQLHGRRLPRCPRRTLLKFGPSHCPRRSIVGSPPARADTVDGYEGPDIVLVNGGPTRLWAHSTTYNPGFFREVVTIGIRKLRHRRWGYRLRFQLPPRVLPVVDVFDFRGAQFRIARRSRPRTYLTSAGRCPRRGLPYRFTARFRLEGAATTSTYSHLGRIACR